MKNRIELFKFNNFIISNFFIPTFLSNIFGLFWLCYLISNSNVKLYSYLLFLVPIFANLLSNLKNKTLYLKPEFDSYGGMIGFLVYLIYIYSKNNISYNKLLEISITTLPLINIFGRYGCYIYGCCYGKKSCKGIIYSNPDARCIRENKNLLNKKLVPVQIYYILVNLISFILVIINYLCINKYVVHQTIIIELLSRICLDKLRYSYKKDTMYFKYISMIIRLICFIILKNMNLNNNINIRDLNFKESLLLFKNNRFFLVSLIISLIYSFHYKKVGNWFNTNVEDDNFLSSKLNKIMIDSMKIYEDDIFTKIYLQYYFYKNNWKSKIKDDFKVIESVTIKNNYILKILKLNEVKYIYLLLKDDAEIGYLYNNKNRIIHLFLKKEFIDKKLSYYLINRYINDISKKHNKIKFFTTDKTKIYKILNDKKINYNITKKKNMFFINLFEIEIYLTDVFILTS